MNNGHSLLKAFKTIGLILTLGVSMNAEAGLFGLGGDSWKEEVLLHDGSKLIVKRSQTYGGRHEIGQPSPIKEHTITFTLPGSNKIITWKDEYSDDIGHSNFNLLALHILNGTPYLVTSPNGSIAYNKWGSPNPPYVFFKYDSKEWQRIALGEFPIEFKTINLVISTLTYRKKLTSQLLVHTETVSELNGSSGPEEYNTILRTPIYYGPPRPEYKGPKAPHPIARGYPRFCVNG